MKTKKCSKCNVDKDISLFYKSKSTKDKLQYKCKECDSKLVKKFVNDNPLYMENWRKDNKKYMKEYQKQWSEDNKCQLIEYQAKYRVNNINKIRIYQNIWMKEKYKNNINYKLKLNIKGRILDALNKGNLKQGENIRKYLGCNIEFYKQYLESQFKPEMNWENHGKIWEIDHIVAISKFNLYIEENIYKAFNYKNTQPLFKTTEIAVSFGYVNELGNRNKGNK